MALKHAGIYKITNTNSGKIYIGSANDMTRRKREHWSCLSRATHHNIKLQRAWSKHGGDCFLFSPIIICHVSDLEFYEQRFIDILNVCGSGYNIRPDAMTNRGVKHTETSKENFRKGAIGRIMPPMSEEAKKNKSASAKRRGQYPPPMTAEQKQRSAEIARKRMTGNSPSPKTREKMRLAKLGKKHSAEHSKKISEALLAFRAKQRGAVC